MKLWVRWFQNDHYIDDVNDMTDLVREAWHTLAFCRCLLHVDLLKILALLLLALRSSMSSDHQCWPPLPSWQDHPLSLGEQKTRPPHQHRSQSYPLSLSLWLAQVRSENIARIANLPYGQSQLYLKSAFIKRKALIKKMKKNWKKVEKKLKKN